MLHRTLLAATVGVLTLSSLAVAQQAQFGTAAEARAMLDKAAGAVRADRVRTSSGHRAVRASRCATPP